MSVPGNGAAQVRDRRAAGIGLMILAMLLIPVVDGLAKFLSSDYSPVYVSWVRYCAGSLVILPIVLSRRESLRFPRRDLGSQVLRTVFLVAAMTLFFIAVSRIPLATAVGAYFVAPIIATILSWLVLREAMTVPKMIAVGAGFAGAVLIIRPGMDVDSGVFYALGSGLLFACYIVATRLAAQNSPPLSTITFQYVFGTILLTPLAVVFWTVPDAGALKFILLMGGVSVLSHLLSINAFRFADASTLSPLVYFELVSATIIGVLFFNEFPDVVTWCGIVFIVAAGFALYRRT